MLRGAIAGCLVAAGLSASCHLGFGGEQINVHEERRFTVDQIPEITAASTCGPGTASSRSAAASTR